MSINNALCLTIACSFCAFVVGFLLADHLTAQYYRRWMVKNGVGKWFADKDGKPFFAIQKPAKEKKK